MIVNKKILRNIGLSSFLKGVKILLTLIMVPLLLQNLGENLYGVLALLLSINSIMLNMDFGIKNSLRNLLTINITLKNFKKTNEYLTTSYVFLGFVTFVFILFYIFLLNNINLIEHLNIKESFNIDIKKIFRVSIFFVGVNLVLSLINEISYSLHKSYVPELMSVMVQSINVGMLLIIKKLNIISNRLLIIVLILGTSTLLINICFTKIILDKEKKIKINMVDFKLGAIKDIVLEGWKFYLLQIAALIIFTTDNIIIGKIVGVEGITPYNITYKIFSIIIVFHSLILSQLWSYFTKAKAENNIKWILQTVRILKCLEIILVIGLIGIYFMFPFIIKVWLGNSIIIPKKLILMFSIYTVLLTYANIYAYLLNSLGTLNVSLGLALIQGFINIPLSIYLAKNLGLGSYGVIMGTNITLLIPMIILPLYYNILIKNNFN